MQGNLLNCNGQLITRKSFEDTKAWLWVDYKKHERLIAAKISPENPFSQIITANSWFRANDNGKRVLKPSTVLVCRSVVYVLM